MNMEITKAHDELKTHSLYAQLDTLENIKIFMKYHVFAVWDFMSLLKSLQREITCVSIPWEDSQYDPKLVRLINEIVVGEESDLDLAGKPCSHFALYLRAMDEIGADTSLIKNFLSTKDFSLLPIGLRDPLFYHLDLATSGNVVEVASSFFFGREKLIPDMFTSMVEVLEAASMECPELIYYFKRHIEVDGGEHGPMAMACLDTLASTEEKLNLAHKTAIESLGKRNALWTFIHDEISKTKRNQIDLAPLHI